MDPQVWLGSRGYRGVMDSEEKREIEEIEEMMAHQEKGVKKEMLAQKELQVQDMILDE